MKECLRHHRGLLGELNNSGSWSARVPLMAAVAVDEPRTEYPLGEPRAYNQTTKMQQNSTPCVKVPLLLQHSHCPRPTLSPNLISIVQVPSYRYNVNFAVAGVRLP